MTKIASRGGGPALSFHVLFVSVSLSCRHPLHLLCHLSVNRPLQSMPPLWEWIRIASVHAQYRCSPIVDGNDVLQAARLLVAGVDSPPRTLR